MIDTETFIMNSPFKVSHNDSNSNYNLTNTTPELLKFQLQEQFRNKMIELKNSSPVNTNEMDLLEDSFNSHLQSNLDSGNIRISESLPSLSSTPSYDEDGFELDSFILNNSDKPNYLNLKVLIENSMLDTSKINKDSILSLSSLKALKSNIDDKKVTHEYLLSKITISQQFVSDIVLKLSNNDEDDVLDSSLLVKILKLNNMLQDQLLEVNSELNSLNEKLNNHNLACLVLGYVEDVKLSSANSKDTPSNSLPVPSPFASSKRIMSSSPKKKASESAIKSFETLFSHIASIAAKRNISLPSPPSPSKTNDIESRTMWAQRCIDAILVTDSSKPHTPLYEKSLNSTQTPSRTESVLNDSSLSSPGYTNDKMMSEYKTALNDLRFSHQYLTKEYEYSRESSMKVIQDYRKRISHLEREVRGRGIPASNSTSSLSTIDDSETVAHKDKEISKLRREINLLKVEKIGLKNGTVSPRLLDSSQSGFHNLRESVSPITGEVLTFPNDNLAEDDDANLIASGSTRPTSMGYSSTSSGTSNGILRKEFKKIVIDIQDQYELEIGQERIRRRKLQAELDKLKQK